MNKKAFAGLFLIITIGAAAFRLADLGLRPVHHDEANQALKFGALLEKGGYRYDKTDHHGPSLYYLTLPFVRISGKSALAELDESTLRMVPACFGIGTVLLLLLFVPLIGRRAVLWGALGLAVSPAMVYFSRFYIQEALLLFFLVAAVASLWRYLAKPSWGWAAATGLFFGMMYATKETSVIAFGSIAAAFVLVQLAGGSDHRLGKARPAIPWPHLILGISAALFFCILLYTSFFSNLQGFFDSILSFKVYFVRAGETGFHSHPWHYYLQTLAFSKTGSGPLWSEALILLLALIGGVAAFRRKLLANRNISFQRFILFFTLLSAAVYSLIPYKTPWNILTSYIGFILLAGVGTASVLDSCRKNLSRALVLIFLAAGFVHLGIQAFRGSFTEPAAPSHPYVYAQTIPDILKLVHRVESLAALHPDGERMLIKVIASPYETWPLPWYLRRFARVGYWTDAAEAGGAGEAAVVISDTEQAARLEPLFKESFLSEYYGLRPNVFLVLHIRLDIWEEFLKSQSGKA